MINKNKKLTNNIKFHRRKEINKMKTRILTICIMVVALAMFAFGAVGCKKATGGGWIPVHDDWSDLDEYGQSASYVDMLGIATFGFQMRCKTVGNQAVVTGNVQYNDHHNSIKLHGTGYWVDTRNTCDSLGSGYPNEFELVGSYSPQPKGDEGTFYLHVIDNGEPGVADPEDYFYIQLNSIGHDGYYFNEGYLVGGNVQVHQDKDK